MSGEQIRAVVAASGLAGESAYEELLQSIVDVARAIFQAQAASITTYEPATETLVFRAVSGAGADSLVGTSFGASEGIAGWVLMSGEPLIIDDVEQDPRFGRGVAEQTGFVPKGLMAVPLMREERPLGVLSVLDRPARPLRAADVELLMLFGRQAALGLDVINRARESSAVLAGSRDADIAARLISRLDALDGRRRVAASALLEALHELLA